MVEDAPARAERIVDARGHRCPTPTLRLRRALSAEPVGAVLVLLADDPMARIDVPHFAAEAGHADAQFHLGALYETGDAHSPSDAAHVRKVGHAVVDCSQDGAVLRFSVRKGASAAGVDHDGHPA